MLDNFRNIQASWVTQGAKIAQVALEFGANDFGSTMIEENVVAATESPSGWTKKRLHILLRRRLYSGSTRYGYNILRSVHV